MKLFEYFWIFLFFVYITHLSYPILISVGWDFTLFFDPVTRFGEDTFNLAIIHSFWGVNLLFLGYILFPRNKPTLCNQVIYPDKNLVKIIGSILISIGLFCEVFLVITQMIGTMSEGYAVAAQSIKTGEGSVISSVFPILSLLTLPGLFCFLVAFKDNKFMQKTLMCSFIIFEMLSMISGKRGFVIMKIIVLLYFYIKCFYQGRINSLKLVLFMALSYFVLMILIYIRVSRLNGYADLNFDYIIDLGYLNVFFSTLYEFGVTINVVCFMCDYLRENINYYGIQFLYSILAIIPKLSMAFPDLKQFQYYDAIPESSLYGGSFIADIIFDWKELSWIIFILFGFTLGWFEFYIKKLIRQKEYLKLIYFMPMMVWLLFCARSGIVNLPRAFVWTAVPIWFTVFIVKSILYNEKRLK